MDLIKQLSQLDDFNILHLNVAEYDVDDTKVSFGIEQLASLCLSDKLLVNEISRTVSDMNLYQLCFSFESQGDDDLVAGIPNVTLPAILLYCNKLEFILSRLAHDLLTPEEMLYGLVPKEALKEAIFTSFKVDVYAAKERSQINKVVKSVNKRAMDKAFRAGVGAL